MDWRCRSVVFIAVAGRRLRFELLLMLVLDILRRLWSSVLLRLPAPPPALVFCFASSSSSFAGFGLLFCFVFQLLRRLWSSVLLRLPAPPPALVFCFASSSSSFATLSSKPRSCSPSHGLVFLRLTLVLRSFAAGRRCYDLLSYHHSLWLAEDLNEVCNDRWAS
jgi:hypothetical protein